MKRAMRETLTHMGMIRQLADGEFHVARKN